MFTLALRNVRIIDGSGDKAFPGNIYTLDDTIAEISHKAYPARREIDAGGLDALPGFVDAHRHGDLTPFYSSEAGELRQGITTFLNGNCGFSAAPSSAEHFSALRSYALPVLGEIPEDFCGISFEDMLRRAGNAGTYSNMGYFVGSGALRIAACGFSMAAPTRARMDKILGLLEDAFRAGAYGLSMGLMYVPENFYAYEELRALCAVAAKWDRPVCVHMRGEGSSLLASVDEVISLARDTGASMHISHLKAAGRKNWHDLLLRALGRIDNARGKGLSVTYDVYPYTAGSTALYTLLPPRLLEGGVAAMLERLRDAATRAALCAELREEQTDWDNLIASTGWEAVTLAGGAEAGRTVAEIAEARGRSGEETALDLLLENGGDLPMVFHSMCREDMELALLREDGIVISDALYSPGGLPHPRKFGAQARFLRRYAERLGWEASVRKVTSLPAERFGIAGRGRLRAGYKADILLIDPAAFRDRATYLEPQQYPAGVEMIIINGRIFTDDSERYGRILRAP